MTDGFALKSWVISLVNKVTKKSNKYSTDETVVGTWVDGKPIYRKVIENTQDIHGTTWTYLNDFDASNIALMISISEIRDGDIITDSIDSYVHDGKLGIQILGTEGGASHRLFILEYTKTTDKATT